VSLKIGVDTFRAFVDSGYRGGFQRIIFIAVNRRKFAV
jgi:hypothetical protein